MTSVAVDKLKHFRESQGHSQELLSKMSGVSVRTIQRLEAGSRASYETSKALASALNLPDLHALSWVGTSNKSVPEDEKGSAQDALAKDVYQLMDVLTLKVFAPYTTWPRLLWSLLLTFSAFIAMVWDNGFPSDSSPILLGYSLFVIAMITSTKRVITLGYTLFWTVIFGYSQIPDQWLADNIYSDSSREAFYRAKEMSALTAQISKQTEVFKQVSVNDLSLPIDVAESNMSYQWSVSENEAGELRLEASMAGSDDPQAICDEVNAQWISGGGICMIVDNNVVVSIDPTKQ